MASQHAFRSRVPQVGSVQVFESATITVVDNTTTNLIMDLPPGVYYVSFMVKAVGVSDNTITCSLIPFADSAQSDVATGYGLVIPGSGSPAATFATTAGAGTVVLLAMGMGTAGANMAQTPLPIMFGCRVTTLTNTGAGAAVGTYTITAMAVEA